MVMFQVDDVAPATTRLPTRRLGELWRDTLAFGGDPATPVIGHGDTHPLLAAVGTAFAQHRPLILSPDVVWLTIAQGVAQHVERWHLEGPAEVIALYQRIETATLFESPRAWRIHAPEDHLLLQMKTGDPVYCVIDLPDGRRIGHRCDPRTGATRWYLCTVREPSLDESRNRTAEPQEISKAAMIDLGASLAEILDAALDADGAIDDHGVIAPGVAQPRPSAP